MTGLLSFLASNAIHATCLLAVGLVADRFLRWPAGRHLIWAAVLLQLLLPSLISITVSLPPAADGGSAVTTTRTSQLGTEDSASNRAPAAPTSGSDTVSLASALTVVELVGAAIFLSLALTRSLRLSRILQRTDSPPEALRQRARLLADKLGLRKLPRIRLTNERVVPMLVALPIPTIVLSKPLIESLGDDEVDALLSHELAHARRGDAWLRPVELLATALYWWLPVVWIARRRLRRAEEAACDALVLSSGPTARRVYAESLLRTIEFTTPTAAATFVTGAANNSQMKERITMILEHSNRKTPRAALMITTAFALLAVLVGPTWAPAQPAAEQGIDEPDSDASGFRIERELIQARMEAYTIENQIQRMALRNEMARINEALELGPIGGPRETAEMQRSQERLALEGERLQIDLRIRQLETDLALRDLALQERMQEQIASGATPPAEIQREIDSRR